MKKNPIVMIILSLMAILLIPNVQAAYEYLPNPNLNYGGGGWDLKNWEWGGCRSGFLTSPEYSVICGFWPFQYECAHLKWNWKTDGTIYLNDWSTNNWCLGQQTYSSYANYTPLVPLEMWGGNRNIDLVIREKNSLVSNSGSSWSGVMLSVYGANPSDPTKEDPNQALDIYIVVGGLAMPLNLNCEMTNPGTPTEMIRLSKTAYGDARNCHDWAFTKTQIANGWSEWRIDLDGLIRYIGGQSKYGWTLSTFKIKRVMWAIEAGVLQQPLQGSASTVSTVDYISMQVESCTNHAQCSQACTTLCPQSVYGCCYGCKLGQCVSGKCQCVDATSYCHNSPPYQKGPKC
jgi:hypothetical protein